MVSSISIRSNSYNIKNELINSTKKKIVSIDKLKLEDKANYKKQSNSGSKNKTGFSNEYSNRISQDLFPKSKYYKANLLNQIVEKMSGLETITLRGQYVEYFA